MKNDMKNDMKIRAIFTLAVLFLTITSPFLHADLRHPYIPESIEKLVGLNTEKFDSTQKYVVDYKALRKAIEVNGSTNLEAKLVKEAISSFVENRSLLIKKSVTHLKKQKISEPLLSQLIGFEIAKLDSISLFENEKNEKRKFKTVIPISSELYLEQNKQFIDYSFLYRLDIIHDQKTHRIFMTFDDMIYILNLKDAKRIKSYQLALEIEPTSQP